MPCQRENTEYHRRRTQDSTNDEEITFVREEKSVAVLKEKEILKKFKSPLELILFVGKGFFLGLGRVIDS
uniref:Transmembrane protein n=1 Tax=Strongyloides stercoralis TaxID=6248 RepID=A0A0K0EK67_STRER